MKFTIGIDEVGRGPLAGPVSVGIVIISEGYDISSNFGGLKDSKQMTKKAREDLCRIAIEEKKKELIQWGVFSIPAKTIDEKGIEHSLQSAIADGLSALMPNPDSVKVFLDGRLKAPPQYEQESIIRGDSLMPIISLASVVAKVSRDAFMDGEAVKYPEYGLERHKGYGTALHIQAIQKYGPSPIHRRTFLKRILHGTVFS